MKIITTTTINIVAAVLLGSASVAAHADADPTSLTILEFADENTLFVADSDAGQILAYELPKAQAAKQSASYNLEGAGSKLAKLLGVDSLSLIYHDIATHPVSKEIYISLSVKDGSKRTPVLVKANQDGEFAKVNLSSLPNTAKKLTKTATDEVRFWRDIPATSLAITENGGLRAGFSQGTQRRSDPSRGFGDRQQEGWLIQAGNVEQSRSINQTLAFRRGVAGGGSG
jgi:type IV secretory pathway VirJ component